MARRSLLFSPGDRPDLLSKAPESGADVLAFDLEDAVAPDRKDAARKAVGEVLSAPGFDPAAEVCVRLTATDPGVDLDALTAAGAGRRLDAVLLPKVGGADAVERHAAMLDERGLDVPVFALLETAAGILDAESIAAAAPTTAVLFGAEDLAADVGAGRTDEGTEVLYARQHVVLAAAAAGVDAIDTVYTDYEDPDGLAAEAADARRLGYDGKMAIHPAQVPVINRAFTPDDDEIEWARRVLSAREEAPGAGVFSVDGEMIDAPLLARAERILERAGAEPPDSDAG